MLSSRNHCSYNRCAQALLAIIVGAYEEVKAVSPLWCEPMGLASTRIFGWLRAPTDQRALYMSDSQLGELLEQASAHPCARARRYHARTTESPARASAEQRVW